MVFPPLASAQGVKKGHPMTEEKELYQKLLLFSPFF